MSLLRIHGNLFAATARCQWALSDGGRAPVTGETRLAELPRHAGRVQLVIPAAQVLLTRMRLPPAARRRSAAMLAFAVEEKTLGEPEANQVSWLGSVGEGGDDDVLAVIDQKALARWRDALDAVGIRACEVHCETLLLPLSPGKWSLAWDGREGYARSGELEGAATDCGDRQTPPLSLRLMLEEALTRGAVPTALALYTTTAEAAPDIAAWQAALGIPVQLAGHWDWKSAPTDAGTPLAQEPRRRRFSPATFQRLRPAAWIAGIALALHAALLVADWTRLATEQRTLRLQMESRFRAAFPEAVAVVDPALQMRRKLAEARHAAGQVDAGDFLPMSETVGSALKELPPGSLRLISYESGRITLELASPDEAALRRIVDRLRQAGLSVDASPTAGGKVVVTMRTL